MYKCPKCDAMPMQFLTTKYQCRKCGYVDPEETKRIKKARSAWLPEMKKI